MQENPFVRHISAVDPDANVWDDESWVNYSQEHLTQPGDVG
jgi:hypothetical protein